MNYTHNIISEALCPEFFTTPGYPLDHNNKPVRDFAMLKALEPSVVYPLNEELEVKTITDYKNAGTSTPIDWDKVDWFWRFKNFTETTTDSAGKKSSKSVFPRLSY